MADPRSDLAALAADLRAHLEDLRGRGVTVLDPSAGLPDAVPWQGAEGDPTPIAAVPDRISAWSALAESSRDEMDTRPLVGAAAMQAVRDELGDCQRCALAGGRTHIVFGVGDPEADLLVVGEAPGYHEDQQGEPFVGKAGQMLDRMLENVLQLSRSQVYIANVMKCRPPDNRNPLPPEVEACRPFLEKQIGVLQPKVILVLGTVALKALWDQSGGITRYRGIWREFRGIPAMPTFHPAYLLRNPAGKRETFEDLKKVRVRYDQLNGRRT